MADHWSKQDVQEGEKRLKNEGFTHIWLRDDRPGETYPPHDHPVTTARIIVTGGFDITIAGETRHCGPGDHVTVPKGVEHSVVVGPKGCCFLMGTK